MIHGLMEAAETEVSSVQKADSLWQIHIYIQMDSDRTATEFMCHSACCRPDLRPKQVGGGGGLGGGSASCAPPKQTHHRSSVGPPAPRGWAGSRRFPGTLGRGLGSPPPSAGRSSLAGNLSLGDTVQRTSAKGETSSTQGEMSRGRQDVETPLSEIHRPRGGCVSTGFFVST